MKCCANRRVSQGQNRDLRPARRSAATTARRLARVRRGGLTQLSASWLRLGIEPHFIRPASLQENGRHERMHRALKKQTSQPPAADALELANWGAVT